LETAPAPRHGSDEPAVSLRRLFATGSAWTLGGYAAAQILRLGSNAVLWRLLDQDVFGIMMLVTVLMIGLQMFSDFGLGPSVVQHERGDDRRFLDTIWTLQILRGTLLWGIAYVLATPFARFYGEPQMVRLVPVVALTALIGGFNSTRLLTARRRVALGRLTAIELAAQTFGIAVMVTWALQVPSIWALAWGGVAAAVVKLLLSHLVLPGSPNRFAWDPASLRAIWHFGSWVLVSTLLSFLQGQGDALMIGKLVPMETLSVYNIGRLFGTVPAVITSSLAFSVVFPIYSRARNEGRSISAAFPGVRLPLLFAAGVLSSGLVACSPPLIDLLYDERAVDARWIVQWIAAGSFFAGAEVSYSAGLLALGQARWLAFGHAAKLIGMVVGIPGGFVLLGLPGAVAGLALAELLRFGVTLTGARRHGLGAVRQDTLVLGGSLLAVGLGLLARGAAPIALPAALEVTLAGGCVTAAWGSMLFLWVRHRRKREASEASMR